MQTVIDEHGIKKKNQTYNLFDIYVLQLPDKKSKWNWEFINIFEKASDDLSMTQIV